MAQVLITSQESPKYSENLFKKFTAFNEPYASWNILDGTGTVQNSQNQVYKGNYSLQAITNAVDTPLVFDSNNDGFSFIVPKTGTYIFSVKLWVDNAYRNNDVFFEFDTFINDSGIGEYQFQCSNKDEGFVHDQWNNFFQVLELTQGDEYNLAFKFYSDFATARAYLDGFKIELDNRALGIPSRYTFPLDTVLEDEVLVTIPSVDSNDTEFVNVTFNGSEVGDYIEMVLPTEMATSELILGLPIVSATDTIRIPFHNHKGSATTAIPDTTFKFKIVK